MHSQLLLPLSGCLLLLFLEFHAMKEISDPYFRREIKIKRIFSSGEELNHSRYDGSDLQYQKFLLNSFPLVLYFTSFVVTKKIWEKITGISKLQNLEGLVVLDKGNGGDCCIENLRKSIINRYCIFYTMHGIGFVCYLHWFTVIYLLGILVAFYFISLLGKSKLNPILTWVFCLIVLFSCDYYRGYRIFEWVFGTDHWLSITIDEFRGSLPWHIYFRMVMLRVLSFNCDKYWSYNKKKVYQSNNEYTQRVVQHLPLQYYGPLQFTSYVLYPPLYIAGPIITFNCFMSQLVNPIKSNNFYQKLKTALWTFALILLLDSILHYSCLNAISISYVWEEWEEAWKVALVGLWTLQFMFLKFLILWRFFRTFALFDDIVAPENMNRCMHNSKSFEDFWRAWHASFNKWTVRYLYVPLGGKDTQHYSVWLIFIFVGLWHDLWWRWVAWALANGLFFTLELIITFEWKKQKYAFIRETKLWEIASHLFAGTNGTFILCSNLSLVYGFDHMPNFVRLVFFGTGAWKVYLILIFCCYCMSPVIDEFRKLGDTSPNNSCPIKPKNK